MTERETGGTAGDETTESAAEPVAQPPMGRDEAFRRYVVPELEVMYRVARSLTRNDADAEDLVQDTVTRAYRALDRFDGRYPRSWLLTILRNTNINNARRKRPELLRDPDDSPPPEQADTAPGAADPERSALEADTNQVLVEAFRSLPKKFRDVVELVDLDRLSYQEAADMLDVPVGTVMSRLHRARRKMRDHIEKAGGLER